MKRTLLFFVVVGIFLTAAFLLFQRWKTTGSIVPFMNTTSITADVIVSGNLGERKVVLNDRQELLRVIEELGIFQPNKISLFGSTYTSGHSISRLNIVFTDSQRSHPIISSRQTGLVRASVDTQLSEQGELTLFIHVNAQNEPEDERLSNLLHLALFNALYLISHDLAPGDIMMQAATYGLEKNTEMSTNAIDNRIIVLSD